nr:uncharacterized protein LOC120962498 [Aegilops tauschii subsp. strangulata]
MRGRPPVGCADGRTLQPHVRDEHGPDGLVPLDDGGGERQCSSSLNPSTCPAMYSLSSCTCTWKDCRTEKGFIVKQRRGSSCRLGWFGLAPATVLSASTTNVEGIALH